MGSSGSGGIGKRYTFLHSVGLLGVWGSIVSSYAPKIKMGLFLASQNTSSVL